MRKSYFAPVIAIVIGTASCHHNNGACRYTAKMTPTNYLSYYKINIKSDGKNGSILYSKREKQSENIISSESRNVPSSDVYKFCDDQISISQKVHRKGDVVNILLDGPALEIAIEMAGNKVIINENSPNYFKNDYELIQSLDRFFKKSGMEKSPF